MSIKISPAQESRRNWFIQTLNRLPFGPNRIILAIILVVLFVLGQQVLEQLTASESPASATENLRVPVAHPPLEPDRPDLIGEPAIDEGFHEDDIAIAYPQRDVPVGDAGSALTDHATTTGSSQEANDIDQ